MNSEPNEAPVEGGSHPEQLGETADSSPHRPEAASSTTRAGGGELALDSPDAWESRSPVALALLALALGLGIEVLFFGHRLGISFPIWALLSALALMFASRSEGIDPDRSSRWLVLPILAMAGTVALRTEPLTVALATVNTLALLALWVRTYRSGDLFGFGWTDFLMALIVVPLESWIRPWGPLAAAQKQALQGGNSRAGVLGVLRGLLLALPVLVVFTALLSAADLVFADRVEQALQWLDLERVTEYLARTTLFLLGGVFSLGAIVLALRPRVKRAGEGKDYVRPFLGLTEALVVLITVDLIFLLFVVIQIAYLFGGEANISAAGYTYSEYARRGFGELVAVSILSLGLIFALGMITRRSTRRRILAFNLPSVVLVLQVGVILASALRRLLLYENAYGFTRLRTYTHLAIYWLAILFAAFLVLLLRGQLRRFALASAAAALGFAATLAIFNVDAFIVRQNVSHASGAGELDLRYLLSLSEDAVPELIRLAEREPGALDSELRSELKCWQGQLQARDDSWPSYHFGRAGAALALSLLEPTDRSKPVWRNQWGTWKHLTPEGEIAACKHQSWSGPID